MTHNHKKSLKSSLIKLWAQIGNRRRIQLSLLFGLSIIASVADILSIGAILPFMAALANPQELFEHQIAQPLVELMQIRSPSELLLPLTIAFVVAAIGAAIIRYLLLWCQIKMAHIIGTDISNRIFQLSLLQPYEVHVSRNSAEIISAVTVKAHQVIRQVIMPLIIITNSVVFIGAVLVILASIGPETGIVAFLGLGCIYIIIVLVTKSGLLKAGQIVNKRQNHVVKILQEGLGGIRDVIIGGTQESYRTLYYKADTEMRHAMAKIQIVGQGPRYAIEMLGIIGLAVFVYTISANDAGLKDAIPIIAALAMGAQRIMPTLQQTYNAWTQIRGSQAVLEEALRLLEQQVTIQSSSTDSAALKFNEKIELKNVSFQYKVENRRKILQNLNLIIRKGSRIGILGPTGCGKSTLLDLLMGLLIPTTGTITIDGIAITQHNSRAWQAHIAHVPQAIFLADATITENIAFGVPANKVDLARVKLATKLAQIDKYIDSLDRGYNTMVGERGVRLSGGQRQRLGIARALYKRASVIILDEATSALDEGTERAIMNAIKDLHEECTIIMVAHRLTTLKNCSEVIELKEGSIFKHGSYASVVNTQVH